MYHFIANVKDVLHLIIKPIMMGREKGKKSEELPLIISHAVSSQMAKCVPY